LLQCKSFVVVCFHAKSNTNLKIFNYRSEYSQCTS